MSAVNAIHPRRWWLTLENGTVMLHWQLWLKDGEPLFACPIRFERKTVGNFIVQQTNHEQEFWLFTSAFDMSHRLEALEILESWGYTLTETSFCKLGTQRTFDEVYIDITDD